MCLNQLENGFTGLLLFGIAQCSPTLQSKICQAGCSHLNPCLKRRQSWSIKPCYGFHWIVPEWRCYSPVCDLWNTVSYSDSITKQWTLIISFPRIATSPYSTSCNAPAFWGPSDTASSCHIEICFKNGQPKIHFLAQMGRCALCQPGEQCYSQFLPHPCRHCFK